MQIDYRKKGAGDVVILIHGGASNNRQWQSLIEDLKLSSMSLPPICMAPERPHRGAERDSYSLADAAALIERLCDSIAGKVSIVGHSLGGVFAMQAAVQLGPRVDKLVLLEAAPYDLLRQAGCDVAYREARSLYEFVCDGSERGEWATIAERFLDVFVGRGAWRR